MDNLTREKLVAAMLATLKRRGVHPELKLSVVRCLVNAGFDREAVYDYLEEIIFRLRKETKQ